MRSERNGNSPDTQDERQLVVFGLGEEDYGVDISLVREIIAMQKITKLPQAIKSVEGIINLRGNIIPVVDLRKRFELPSTDYTSKTRIIVVEIDGETVGLIVDCVLEVIRVPATSIEPPESIVVNLDENLVEGIAKLDDRLIILLDVSKVLSLAPGERVRLDEARDVEISAE